MATYYFRNAGTDWGTAANWSLTDGGGATGVVPLATDDVIFTNNSGNCTVNALNRVCQTLNFNGGTGYTNTITFTFNISVGGAITLGASMVFAGAALLRYVGGTNSTLTSNAKEVGVPFEITSPANHTITFADDWTFGENFTLQSGAAASTMTFNGSTLNCKKSLFTGVSFQFGRLVTGTTSIIMIGTGSIGFIKVIFQENSNNVGLNLTINTVGSYTLNSLTWGYLGGKTFTYISGTITVAANSILLLNSQTGTPNILNLNGIDFETISVNVSSTYTLTSNLKCKSLSVQAVANSVITFNGNTLFLTSLGNSVTVAGSTIFYFDCWSGDGSFNSVGHAVVNTIIDISNGNTLFLGSVGFGEVNLTHLQGSFVPSTAFFNGTTINIQSNVVFGLISSYNNSVGWNFTLQSNITTRNLGNITQQASIPLSVNGVGYSVTVLDSFIVTGGPLGGTAKLIMGGNTNVNIGSVTFFTGVSIEFEINSPGVVALNTTIGSYPQAMFSGIFRHVKGQVIAKGSTIWFMNGSTILGASRCHFDNVQIRNSGTVNMDEFFCGTLQLPTKVTGNGNYTINFTDGFEKIAKNVIVTNCTISRRGQLLLLSKGSFKSTNIGIRYYNQSPNGVGSNLSTFVNDNLVGTQAFRKIPMLVGDPVFT